MAKPMRNMAAEAGTERIDQILRGVVVPPNGHQEPAPPSFEVMSGREPDKRRAGQSRVREALEIPDDLDQLDAEERARLRKALPHPHYTQIIEECWRRIRHNPDAVNVLVGLNFFIRREDTDGLVPDDELESVIGALKLTRTRKKEALRVLKEARVLEQRGDVWHARWYLLGSQDSQQRAAAAKREAEKKARQRGRLSPDDQA